MTVLQHLPWNSRLQRRGSPAALSLVVAIGIGACDKVTTSRQRRYGTSQRFLQDAYVRWSRKSLGVQIGQFKTPFTRDFLTSLSEVETADRSTVVDSLAPKRDIGVMADYALGGPATIAAGIFNGEGRTSLPTRTPLPWASQG